MTTEAFEPERIIRWNRQYEQFTRDTYKKFGQLMVRAWLDADYARELKANPADEMRKAGIPLPEGLDISPEQFVMPDRPLGVSVETLRATVAASTLGVADMEAISCAGSASSLSCPSCTAACCGSGGC